MMRAERVQSAMLCFRAHEVVECCVSSIAVAISLSTLVCLESFLLRLTISVDKTSPVEYRPKALPCLLSRSFMPISLISPEAMTSLLSCCLHRGESKSGSPCLTSDGPAA